METINKLVALYARVSTSNQEEQKTIEGQLNEIHEYAEKHNYKIVREYTDNGWSGDNLARPQLDQLRTDARRGLWDGVIVYDPDRLARRLSYQQLVIDELQDARKEVFFTTIATPRSGEERMMYGLRGLFSEYERLKIAERFRIGKVRKIKDGHVLLSEPPYGYDYVKMDKDNQVHGYLVVNEREAQVVKMIFHWVAVDKLTLRHVVRRLDTKCIQPRKSKRGVWSTSTLSTLLRNEVYIGRAFWGKSEAIEPTRPFKNEKYKKIKKTSRRIRPQDEWSKYAVAVPAIIDETVFKMAGEQLTVNFNNCKRNKKNEYLVANLVRCTCGKTRTGEGSSINKNNRYYRCSDRVSSFPKERTCLEGGIRAPLVDELVWNKISQLMTSTNLLLKQLNRWVGARGIKNENSIDDTKSLTEQVTKLQIQIDRHNQAYGKDLYTMDELARQVNPLREQIANLTERLAETRKRERESQVTVIPTAEDIETMVEQVRKTIHTLNFSQKRDIVLSTVERIIASQKEVTVMGYIPVNPVFTYVNFKTSSRNRGTPECRQIDTL